MRHKKLAGIAFSLLIITALAFGDSQITDTGAATDIYIGATGLKPTVAVDGSGQAHAVIVDPGLRNFSFYHKLSTGQPPAIWNLYANTGKTGTINNPHLEIEQSTGRAWCSGVMYKAGDVNNTGMAILSRQNVSSTPGPIAFVRDWVLRGRGWPIGNLAVEPNVPNSCIVYACGDRGQGGEWQQMVASGDALSRGAGYGNQLIGEGRCGGERSVFAISKAGTAVKHAAIGGHPEVWGSYYDNSVITPNALWADVHHYTDQEEEWNYPSICTDNENPNMAYIACYSLGSEGIILNVWNGGSMAKPINNMVILNGYMDIRRYGPQMSPAANGGAWVCFTRSSNIYIQYVSQDGTLGPETWITAGYLGAIADDLQGGLHLVYMNGGARYRKITVTGGGGASITKAGDFGGGAGDDLAIYDPVSANWYIRTLGGTQIEWPLLHGNTNNAPVPLVGDFNGDGTNDLASYETATSNWYIRTTTAAGSRALAWGEPFGVDGGTPLVGDFNNDNNEDIAFYKSNGDWDIRSLVRGADTNFVSIGNFNWGFAGTTPLSADFDGDGDDECAVYDKASGNWHIRTLDGTTTWSINWGFSGATPVAADYDGDGKADLAVYDKSGGYWYIRRMDGKVLAYKYQFGFSGGLPVPGDYDGDGADDLCIFDPVGANWYIITLDREILVWGTDLGGPGQSPVPADYDNDGKTDLATYHHAAGNWYIANTGGTALAWGLNHGFSTAKPLAANYDGTGGDDLAVYDTASGNWYIRTLAGAQILWGANWGFAGAIPLAGNFDGVGGADPAVYNPATGDWFIRTVGGTTLAWAVNWGFPGAIPVPADYNGDNKTDLGIFNPATGDWFIRTLSGTTLAWAVNWGFPGTIPVPADYNNDGKDDLGVYESESGLWYARTLSGQAYYTGALNVFANPYSIIPVPANYDGTQGDECAVFNPSVSIDNWFISKDFQATALAFPAQHGYAGVTVIGVRN